MQNSLIKKKKTTPWLNLFNILDFDIIQGWFCYAVCLRSFLGFSRNVWKPLKCSFSICTHKYGHSYAVLLQSLICLGRCRYVLFKFLLVLSSLQSVRSWWGFAVWWRNPSPNPWLRSWSVFASLSTSQWSSFQRTSYSMSRWRSGNSVTAWSHFTLKVCHVLVSFWAGCRLGSLTRKIIYKIKNQLYGRGLLFIYQAVLHH